MQPLLSWETKDNTHPQLVWRSKLDKRYLIEVQRTDDYHGKLVIFDHEKNDQEIACWDVNLTYGAIFGPDVADIAEWQDKTIDFIDNAYGNGRT